MVFFNHLSDKKIIILLISIILNLFLLFLSIFLIWKVNDTKCVEKDETVVVSMEEDVVEENFFYVEVKGSVKKPGVYEVKNNNIINDVINLAGGFTKSAYTNNINLSKKVSNELVIYVYTKEEYKKINEEPVIEACVCPSYDVSDCINDGKSEIITSDSNSNVIASDENILNNTAEVKNSLININTASKEELMTLSGIGESKADNIIEYRSNNGKFNTIEDIKNVNGIGESAFEKIKNNITV